MLYRRPDGVVVRPTDVIGEPHKVMLSPDEKTFYTTDGDKILAFEVQRDGALVHPRVMAELHAEDLVVDSKGRLYASTENAIEVMDSQGKRLGSIPTPIHIQNFAFTGKDRKTIIAAGKGNVYRIDMLSEGFKGRAK